MFYRIKKRMNKFVEVEFDIEDLNGFVVEDFALEYDLNKGDIIEFREKKNSKIIKYKVTYVQLEPEYHVEKMK